MMNAIKQYIIYLLAGILLLGCAGSGIFTESEAIKPLNKYNSPVQRDIAQMLYPGFTEMKQELEIQFPGKNVRFHDEGLEILKLSTQSPGLAPGYYIGVTITTPETFPNQIDFLEQAQRIGANYFHPMLLLLSRDWNNVFSSSLSGTAIDIYWTGDQLNRLRIIFDNHNIEEYLNARMTLQELVDKSWIEAWQGEEDLGRIELNNLTLRSTA